MKLKTPLINSTPILYPVRTAKQRPTTTVAERLYCIPFAYIVHRPYVTLCWRQTHRKTNLTFGIHTKKCFPKMSKLNTMLPLESSCRDVPVFFYIASYKTYTQCSCPQFSSCPRNSWVSSSSAPQLPYRISDHRHKLLGTLNLAGSVPLHGSGTLKNGYN